MTMVGSPEPASIAVMRASGSTAPFGPVGTLSSASAPMPSRRSERSIVAWRSSPATTRILGAPCRPRRSTSQPARSSTRWRAAASPTVLPACVPVTIPNDASAGRPSDSFSHAPAISSTNAAAGDDAPLNAIWSQPLVRTSAPSAASSDPPTTKPKKREPAEDISAGSTATASSSSTDPAWAPLAGSGPPSSARRRSRSATGATRRSARDSR